MKTQVIVGVVVVCLLIGVQSAYAVPAFQSGFNYGVQDATSNNTKAKSRKNGNTEFGIGEAGISNMIWVRC